MKIIFCVFTFIFSLLMTSCEKTFFNSSTNDVVTSTGDSSIVFISRRIENSSNWNLLKMNLDGTEQTKLAELTVRYAIPVISHSGKKVLFVHYTNDFFYELYLIDIDGTNLKLIDRANRYCGSADWSTDDLKIIYSKNRNESTDDRDLVLYDIVSGNKQILTTSFNNISGKFTNTNKIIYSQQSNSSSDIYSMNFDGSDKKIVIAKGSSPVLSPDYKKIAYMSEAASWNPQIFVANLDGSQPGQLTNTSLHSWDSGFPDFGNFNPHWTPDGKMIVYESQINDGESEIYIMNGDGSDQKRLTNTDGHNTEPEVSLDGKFIIFSSSRNLSYASDIYIMDIDGKNQNPLSKYVRDDCCPVLASK